MSHRNEWETQAGEESLLWAGHCKRAADESWVKFLTEFMEPQITQGGESRMSREVIRKVISTPDLLDFKVRGEGHQEVLTS